MAIPLFTNDEASDLGYRNIRDAKKGPLRFARWHCDYLWIVFQHHADNEFRKELRSNFDARYWEMYLTCSLIFAGHEVTCPKPGPDVGIMYKGQRIWFEATSPGCGAPGSPDYAGGPVQGAVPEEKIILRYLNSISTKYKDQYANWLKRGLVSEKDAFVIAINPWSIPWDHTDGDPPRILQAGYTIGTPYAKVERETLKPVGIGYESKDKIMKASEVSVDTGVFQREEYKGLSALLCSRAEVANRPSEMGGDFQLAPNPNATVPWPTDLRLRGVYYDFKKTEGALVVTPRRGA
jgi:hypothetical protein